jgi:hypothetical protein
VYADRRYAVVPPSVLPNGAYIRTGTSKITDLPESVKEHLVSVGTTHPGQQTFPLQDGLRPDLEDIRGWCMYRPFVEHLLSAYGLSIDVRFLPPWRDASGNSAAVTLDRRGLYICFDNGRRADPKSLTIPELYAALTTARARRLSRKATALWAKRAQADLGYRTLRPVDHPSLPEDLTENDRKIYGIFLHRWQLRQDEPSVAFSCGFPADWLGEPGLSRTEVHRSLNRIRERGLIHKAGEAPSGYGRPTFLYRLGDGTPDPTVPDKPKRPSPKP